MSMTLLEMVQGILNSMDSDEINSINDTVESRQVAQFVKDSYYEIVAGQDLPSNITAGGLQGLSDTNQPIVMSIPSNIANVKWIKYDCQESGDTTEDYREVYYLEPKDFFERSYNLDATQSNVATMTLESFDGEYDTPIKYLTDKAPEYYTVLGGDRVIFDSIDTAVDATLQQDKVLTEVERLRDWEMEDSFTPVLSPAQFQLLYSEAKRQAFVEAKQGQNPVAEQRARRNWVRTSRNKVPMPYYTNMKLRTNTNFGKTRRYVPTRRDSW